MIDDFDEWYQELERIIILTKNSTENRDKELYREYHDQGLTPAQAWHEELLIAQEEWIAAVNETAGER